MNAYLAPSGNGAGAGGGAAGGGVPWAGAGRGAGACGAAAWANVGAADNVKLSAAATARPLIRVNPFNCRKFMILLQISHASNIGKRAPHRRGSPAFGAHRSRSRRLGSYCSRSHCLMFHSIRVVLVL